MAACNSIVDRHINIPMSDINYKKEIETIKYLAINNDFKLEMFDRMVNNHNNRKNNNKAKIKKIFV